MLCSSDSAVVLSDENSSAELTVLCSRSTVFGETEILSVTSFPYQNHRVWGIIMFIY